MKAQTPKARSRSTGTPVSDTASRAKGKVLPDYRSTKQDSKNKFTGNSSVTIPSDTVIQCRTKIENFGQNYTYGYEADGSTLSDTVGLRMNAQLDPTDMRRGQSANVNTSQSRMIGAIQTQYPNIASNLVKGHLLNDNLGGSALGNNLFPITGTANHNHLVYVENDVKQRINSGTGVRYDVNVVKPPTPQGQLDIDVPAATFRNTIQNWNPQTNTLIGPARHIDVPSHLGVAPVFVPKKIKKSASQVGNKKATSSNGKKGLAKKVTAWKVTYPTHPVPSYGPNAPVNMQTQQPASFYFAGLPANAKDPKEYIQANATKPLLVLTPGEVATRNIQPFNSKIEWDAASSTMQAEHRSAQGNLVHQHQIGPND